MEKNVGRTDAFIRIVLAVVLLYFLDNFSDAIQIIMAVIAVALIFTALNGICLLYKPFGYSSRKVKKPKS